MQNLTDLDVSENSIEQLDLSSLSSLKCINCSKNQLTDLKLNGSELITIAASNNSKLIRLINLPGYSFLPCRKQNLAGKSDRYFSHVCVLERCHQIIILIKIPSWVHIHLVHISHYAQLMVRHKTYIKLYFGLGQLVANHYYCVPEFKVLI